MDEPEENETLILSGDENSDESALDVIISDAHSSISNPFEPRPKKIPKRGPSSEHPVWEHFTKIYFSNESQCNACKEKLKKMKTTNCVAHLEKKHKNLFRQYSNKAVVYKEKKEKAKGLASQSSTTLKNQTLEQAFSGSQTSKEPYSKNSLRQVEITDSLALFVGTNSVALRVVETPNFKEFVRKLDPRYRLPTRHDLSDRIKELASKIRITVQSKINESGKITICSDIWSRPGLTESFLGISAHFYSRVNHQRYSVLLSLAPFPSPHTADRLKVVLDDCLQEWGIDDDKILRFVTDNGSNMVKALRNEALIYILKTQGIDEDDPDVLDEFGLEIETESDDEEAGRESSNEEIAHNPETVMLPKHMRCFAHSLMCVLRNTVDTNVDFSTFRKTIIETVKKVCRSTKLQERLKQLGGLKLVLPTQTRWNSTYFVFDRVRKLSIAMDQLAKEERWDLLPWRTLELYCTFLEPFAKHTDFLQGSKYPTISSVIPTLIDIQEHLQIHLSDDKLAVLATAVQKKIVEYFGYTTDVKNGNFDGTYIMATFLDPTVALCLDDAQLEKAKAMIAKISSDNSRIGNPAIVQLTLEATHLPQSVLQRIEKRRQTAASATSTSSSVQNEIISYWSELVNGNVISNPIDFWVRERDRYRQLYDLAIDILGAPATSAPLEGYFSQASIALDGRRYRLNGKSLEAELFLRVNSMIE